MERFGSLYTSSLPVVPVPGKQVMQGKQRQGQTTSSARPNINMDIYHVNLDLHGLLPAWYQQVGVGKFHLFIPALLPSRYQPLKHTLKTPHGSG